MTSPTVTAARLEDLIYWLDKKYSRHHEEEDKEAADALREYAALRARSALADVGEKEFTKGGGLSFEGATRADVRGDRATEETGADRPAAPISQQPRPAAEEGHTFAPLAFNAEQCSRCGDVEHVEAHGWYRARPAAHTAQGDAKAMRCYYVTAHTQGFVNSPLWHELAEETRETYRQHVSHLAEQGSGAKESTEGGT